MSLEYLEEERKKLWKEVEILKEDVAKKTSDYERDAKESSKRTSEYRNRANKTEEEAKNKLNEINDLVEEIKKGKTNSKRNNTEIETNLSKSKKNLDELVKRKDKMGNLIERLEMVSENHPKIEEEIESLEDNLSKIKELYLKIKTLHTNSVSKRGEINTIYNEIIGYTEVDEETGEETEIKGLKENLENTYNDLKKGFGNLIDDLAEIKNTTETNFNDKVTTWALKYDTVLTQIEKLLPKALTTGLSYAYSEKKESEVKESGKLAKKFKDATLGLIGVSLIPFAVGIVSLFNNKTLEEVILDMPRLVLAIFPLYIPVLWLAYSANKKHNLSKRLIEEYTHKEVLSKTFEGLSTQIEKLEEGDVSKELKTKLLYNLLTISSENPGKLISDYNKSDHPLMDTLDKSVKLASAIENLSKIPGFSKIANILNLKLKKKEKDIAKKVEKGFESIDEE